MDVLPQFDLIQKRLHNTWPCEWWKQAADAWILEVVPLSSWSQTWEVHISPLPPVLQPPEQNSWS
jgi:hypothetical protein